MVKWRFVQYSVRVLNFCKTSPVILKLLFVETWTNDLKYILFIFYFPKTSNYIIFFKFTCLYNIVYFTSFNSFFQEMDIVLFDPNAIANMYKRWKFSSWDINAKRFGAYNNHIDNLFFGNTGGWEQECGGELLFLENKKHVPWVPDTIGQ